MDQLNPLVEPVIIIVRIEFLLVFAALLMVLRYILDIFRSRSSNRMLQLSLLILDFLPYIYLDIAIGLMQLGDSKNDLYQVWAVVMVILRYSISAVRPSGIYREQRPLMDMMTTLWTANLLGTRTTKLKAPLWLLWSLNSVRLILGFADSELGPTKLRRNIQFISEYMRNEHKISATYYSPKDMKGYRYLVWGENKQKVETHAPDYRVQVLMTEKRKFFTVEKIWQEENILLQNNADSNQLKDLCLSFALFKLLQRRILGLPLYEAKQQKTKDLVNELLQDYDRAFSIIKVELAFLTEFYYTRFGNIFANGFPTLRLVLSLSVVGVCIYLLSAFAGSLHVLFGDVSYNSDNVIRNKIDKISSNLIVCVTWILVVSLMLREFWEMATYALSDWTKVILVCNSFEKKWWMKCPGILLMMRFLCKKRVAPHWHSNLQQHNLLQSYLRSTICINSTFSASLNIINSTLSRRHPGGKLDPRFKLPNEVKRAISKSVQYLLQNPNRMEFYLSNAADALNLSLEGNVQISLISNLESETRKILVWHIATSYCEITIPTVGDNPPRVASLDSPFFWENLDGMEEGLESHYKAAVALSQYSCHLLNLTAPLVPDNSLAPWNFLNSPTPLLPDRVLVVKELFRSTQQNIQRSLNSCHSWDEVSEKLNHVANEVDDINEEEKGKIILKMGVRLGKELINVMTGNNKTLWEFLEKFWSGYLLYLASSVSPNVHQDALSRGGEFLTHVWALLSHAGILGK